MGDDNIVRNLLAPVLRYDTYKFDGTVIRVSETKR